MCRPAQSQLRLCSGHLVISSGLLDLLNLLRQIHLELLGLHLQLSDLYRQLFVLAPDVSLGLGAELDHRLRALQQRESILLTNRTSDLPAGLRCQLILIDRKLFPPPGDIELHPLDFKLLLIDPVLNRLAEFSRLRFNRSTLAP